MGCAEETSLSGSQQIVEFHRFCQEEQLEMNLEDDQKLVDGYQKHLTKVKMAKRHWTEYQIDDRYIFDPAYLVTFSEYFW